MSDVGTMPRKELDLLVARAERLCDAVVQSTEFSPIPEVRREGARFVAIVEGWVDELEALLDTRALDLEARVRSFETRLCLAERKVAGWWKPPAARLRAVSSPGRRARRVSAA